MNDGSLEIRDVTVQFGGLTALDRVSLTARPGQVTGIIGPNGAGKTTLLNTVCGFVKPSRTSNASVRSSAPRRETIRMSFVTAAFIARS